MPKLLRYILGYLYIEISGNFPERFLNVCAANRIKLWDYNKKGKAIYAKILSKDYLKIRPIRSRCDVHLRIVSRHGLPKKAKPYKRRYGMLLGIALYAFTLLFLTNFIWNIEINGTKSLTKETILKSCEEIGVYEGCYKKGISTENARHRLIMKNGDISWASFIIEGSHLTVNILETQRVEKTDKSPSNLVAMRDGFVEKVEVKRGMSVVKVNTAVVKGDILATGAMQYKDGTTHFVNSSGKVIAKTKRTKTVTVKKSKIEKIYTKKEETKRVLHCFGIDVPLSFKPVAYLADKNKEEIKIMNGTSYVPVYLEKTTFKQYINKPVLLSEEDMLKEAKKRLNSYQKKMLNECEIISFYDEIIKRNDDITIKRHYVCRENIAKVEKIKINTVN